MTNTTKTILCPICKKPVATDLATFPFCNARCRTIDLGNWLDEKYSIEVVVDHDKKDD